MIKSWFPSCKASQGFFDWLKLCSKSETRSKPTNTAGMVSAKPRLLQLYQRLTGQLHWMVKKNALLYFCDAQNTRNKFISKNFD